MEGLVGGSVLRAGGVSFAGLIAFIYADLIPLPVILLRSRA